MVIPRGVDVSDYQPHYRPDDAWLADWRQQYPVLEKRFVITLPGRVSRRKGVLHLVSIIAGLQARGIAAHGLIVGEPPPAGKSLCKGAAVAVAAAGLADCITLTGYRKDVREIMSVSRCRAVAVTRPRGLWSYRQRGAGTGYSGGRRMHMAGLANSLHSIFRRGSVPPGDVDAMTGRLSEWSLTPPSMQDVRVYVLQDMLDSTLALYHGLVFQARMTDLDETDQD